MNIQQVPSISVGGSSDIRQINRLKKRDIIYYDIFINNVNNPAESSIKIKEKKTIWKILTFIYYCIFSKKRSVARAVNKIANYLLQKNHPEINRIAKPILGVVLQKAGITPTLQSHSSFLDAYEHLKNFEVFSLKTFLSSSPDDFIQRMHEIVSINANLNSDLSNALNAITIELKKIREKIRAIKEKSQITNESQKKLDLLAFDPQKISEDLLQIEVRLKRCLLEDENQRVKTSCVQELRKIHINLQTLHSELDDPFQKTGKNKGKLKHFKTPTDNPHFFIKTTSKSISLHSEFAKDFNRMLFTLISCGVPSSYGVGTKNLDPQLFLQNIASILQKEYHFSRKISLRIAYQMQYFLYQRSFADAWTKMSMNYAYPNTPHTGNTPYVAQTSDNHIEHLSLTREKKESLKKENLHLVISSVYVPTSMKRPSDCKGEKLLLSQAKRILITGKAIFTILSPDTKTVLGYDGVKITFTIDPTRINPKELLLSDGAVTVTETTAGLQKDIPDVVAKL